MATIIVTTGADPVVNGTNFQSALNSSAFGDTIVLQAGSSYYGNFILPNKGAGTGTDADYITIQTSNLAGLPAAGTRITNTYGAVLPKLVSYGALGLPAIEGASGAHHFSFLGIEITNIGGSIVSQELVVFGKQSSGGPLNYANRPHHMIFDRCWIHEATNDTTTPDSTTTRAIRGFFMDADQVTVKECRVAGFRTYQPTPAGVEASNCVLFPTMASNVLIQNCYLESWFVPIFFGGGGGSTPNEATLSSPAFNLGTHTGSAIFSTVSNLAIGDLVSLKTTGGHFPVTNAAHPGEPVDYQVAKVTNIAGSTVSFQSWGSYDGDVAGGSPLLQTPDAPGNAKWNGYMNEYITIKRNTFMLNFNSTEAVWVGSGGSPTTGSRDSQVSTGNAPKGFMEFKECRHILVQGNTYDGWGNGIVVTNRNQGLVGTGCAYPWFGVLDLTFRDNWFKKTINWDRKYGFPVGGPLLDDNECTSCRGGPFTFTNNLIEHGVEHIFASMIGADNVTCTHNTMPGFGGPITSNSNMLFAYGSASNAFTFKDNILSNNEYGMNCQLGGGCWPGKVQTKNVIIDNRSAGAIISDPPLTVNYPNDFIATNQAAVGWVDQTTHNYRLTTGSTYHNQASDGTDPGVNMDTLLAALGGTEIITTPRQIVLCIS